MCGIAGALNLASDQPVAAETVKRMLAVIRHRGPEAAGIHLADRAALGHARLSIIDLAGGLQPIANEDGAMWVICNGEVFNYVELMAELKGRGHQFRTASDSEVILHLYEELGAGCLDHFIGQYAFAIWDGRRNELFIARDRLGVRPLFYTVAGGTLLFASEIKALLADPRVSDELDLLALDQVFTYWSPLPGRTLFRDVAELPAGHYLKISTATPSAPLRPVQYWNLDFPDATSFASADRGVEDYASELRELLIDATRLRLRADVPVGAYLSGGLDSSAIAALIRAYTGNDLQTFSIAFRNPHFDETHFQQQMAQALGTQHHAIQCDDSDVARVFPDVIWHCETPLLRTGPAPMYMLANFVREQGLKVVLTGEGSDEFLGGYSIFKEAKVRRWWAAQADSKLRPMLFRRLHGEVAGMDQGALPFLKGFFGNGLQELDDPAYSHLVRWRSTARQKRFFSAEVKAALSQRNGADDLSSLLDERLSRWDGLSKAQYVEAKIFLSQYLLSSQGDRVAMAHSVEGRFPFLDHRVVEFAATIPPRYKLRGLNEKYILKRAVGDLLPPAITARTKQPYRAPISTSFFGPKAPLWVADVLSEDEIRNAGIFDATSATRLIHKCRTSAQISEGDNMAVVGIISTQLLNRLFRTDRSASLSDHANAAEPVIVEATDALVAQA
jgi:asparagine synthase (glutamine-hydrolysing)